MFEVASPEASELSPQGSTLDFLWDLLFNRSRSGSSEKENAAPNSLKRYGGSQRGKELFLPRETTAKAIDSTPRYEKRESGCGYSLSWREVSLSCACVEKPAPGHGEDAAACGPNFQIVADGVGGSKESSALLARSLANFLSSELFALYSPSTRALEKRSRERKGSSSSFLSSSSSPSLSSSLVDKNTMHALALRAIAKAKAQCKGTVVGTTMSVAYVDLPSLSLHTLTLGDSKTVVIRDRRVVFETISVTQSWNVPAVVGTMLRDCVAFINWESFSLQEEDVVLTFSDGVSDNLFEDELLDCVAQHRGQNAEKVAQAVAELSKACANSGKDRRPFAVSGTRAYHKLVTRLSQDRRCSSLSSSSLNSSVSLDFHLRQAVKLMSLRSTRRKCMDKEVMLSKNSEYYSLQQLSEVSQAHCGKKDDISVCCMFIKKNV